MIKNDPSKYVKRSDLIPQTSKGGAASSQPRTLDDFLDAEIDEAGYITFPRKPPVSP